MTSIEYEAFAECSSLESINIPNKVRSIGDGAFYNCRSLRTVTIPDSVTSIADDAFNGSVPMITCSQDSYAYNYAVEKGIEMNVVSSDELNIKTTMSTIKQLSDGSYLIDVVDCYKMSGTLYVEIYDADGECMACTTRDKSAADVEYRIEFSAEDMENASYMKIYIDGGSTENEILDVETNESSFGSSSGSASTPTPTAVSTAIPTAAPIVTETPVSTPTPTAIPTATPTSAPTDVPSYGTDGSITWDVTDGVLTITGSGEIPDYDEGTAPWYAFADSIKTIIVQDSVSAIGDYAFYGLNKALKAEITSDVNNITINEGVFAGCSALSAITLPETVSGIGAYAFKDCGLTSITVPDSVKSVGKGTFAGCNELVSITLPFIGSQVGTNNNTDTFSYIFAYEVPSSLKNVAITNETRVPDSAFAGLENITSITVNDSVSTIGTSAFDGCKSLKSFAIPDGIVSINEYTFRNCSSVVSISVPDSVKSIGEGAFDGCAKLASINIPSGVTVIADDTFNGCASLKSIEIPTAVTSIGESVLEGCTSLISIKVPFVGSSAAPDATMVTDEGIFGYFFNCANSEIPSAVTRVEVTSTDLSGYIPMGAFKDCGYIEDIIIDGGRAILDNAFVNCKNLKNLYIPQSVSNIGVTILADCTRLETLVVPFIGKNKNDSETETSVLGGFFGYNDVDITGIMQYYNGTDYHYYKIPNTLKNVSVLNNTNISSYAFMGCDFVKKVAIITAASIGDKAFYDCASLESVTLPYDLTSIGYQAFAECKSLETINIPTKVKTIGEGAFYNCRALKNVTMPDSVTEIADDIFNGTNLFEISVMSSNGTITCSEGSAAYEYALANNITPNVVSSEALNVKKTATSVALLSDNSYLFDITDSYNMEGTLYVDLYDEDGNLISHTPEEKTTSDVEIRMEFSAEKMENVSYAKIYIDGATSEDEVLLMGEDIPESADVEITMEYKDGFVYCTCADDVTYTGTAVLIEAVYDDKNILDHAKIIDVSNINNPIEVEDPGTSTVKFMLWNNTENMKPLAEAI